MAQAILCNNLRSDLMDTKLDNRLLEQKKKMEQSLSLDFMGSDLRPIHNIYFDISILQDIFVGTLLLHTNNEEEYNRILACLPVYLSRVEPAICKYFPSTTLTDDYIFDFIKNPANAERLYTASPHTTIWYMLPAIFQKIYENNRKVDKPDKFYCNMYVNLYPTGYGASVCNVMANCIKRINDKITFNTITKPVTQVQQSTRMIPDVYFVEDIGKWMGTDSIIYKEFYEDLLYENKQFYSKRVITNTEIALPIDESFIKSRNFIRTFTDFDYLDVSIRGVQYIPPVPTISDNIPDDDIND